MPIAIKFNRSEFDENELKRLKVFMSGFDARVSYFDKIPILPVRLNGENKFMIWGNKTHPELPKTGFCKVESLQAGKWQWLKPEMIEIIANRGFSNGTWYQIREGIRGLMIKDKKNRPYCYMLTQPATHYYKTMTGSERMPVLINQII